MKMDNRKSEFGKNLSKGHFRNAEEIVNSLLEKNPKSAELHSMKGCLFETMGRLKDSIKCFKKAWSLDPSEREYLYWICEIYLMFYDIENTLNSCKMGNERFPDDFRFKMVEADAHQWKISIQNLTGLEKEEALRESRNLLDECLAIKPEHGEIKVIEGTWFIQKGEFEKCLESFKLALEYGLELFADYIDIGLCLSILYLKMGEKNKASRYLKYGLDKFRNWNEPHYLKLFLYYEHLLMLDELYFGKKIRREAIEPFANEYNRLIDNGMKVHHVTRSLRNHVWNFLTAREEKNYKQSLEALDKALKIFKSKLPLCIIFNSIKKPSLIEVLRIYKSNVLKFTS